MSVTSDSQGSPAWPALLHPGAFVRAVWNRRALLGQLTWRQIQTQNRGSFLGIFWLVLQPLLVFSVYGFVFVLMFQGRFGESPSETSTQYAIGIFIGLNVVQLFQEALTASPRALVSQPNFVKKIVFPLEILPLSLVGAALFRSIIGLILALLALGLWGPQPDLSALWMGPIVLIVLLWATGTAWILSALGVFLRDLEPLTQFFSLAIMFLSAVFYSASRIPDAWAVLRGNPLLVCVEAARDVLLWHETPNLSALVLCGLAGVLFCILAHAFFAGVKGAFADCL